MLLTSSSLLSPPLKHHHKSTKVAPFGTYDFKLTAKKLGFNYCINGDTHLASPHHPLESGPPLPVECGGSGGLGIDKFFEGKNIFITGATGLLGKALVEKLLRSTSVGKIYVLLKADNKEIAVERLSKEIVGSDLFECLREKHGSSYEEFARAKLIPVAGNIYKPNIGMDASSANAVMEEVDVIIESAANTNWHERYDFSLEANVNGPRRLLGLAKRCKNLKLFVHFSTAYISRREGTVFEKPWTITGESEGMYGNDDDEDTSSSSSLPQLDLAEEMKFVTKSRLASTDYEATKDLRRLGLERAAHYGYCNTYRLTKALGEMAVDENREDVPVLVLRPSIIESSYREPIPGWIQGNRMYDPVIISYAKGQFPAYLADPDVHTHIIPVDMAANTTIAAIAKHGITSKPELNVYHLVPDFENPLRFADMFDYIYEYFSANPLTDRSENLKKIKMFDKFSEFSKYLREEMSENMGINGSTHVKVQRQYKAKVAYAEQLLKTHGTLGFYKVRYQTDNTKKLLEEMSKQEKATFEVDATKIDWRKYVTDIHIPGLRKYVLKDTRDSVRGNPTVGKTK